MTAICADGDGTLLVAAATDRPGGCDVALLAARASGLPPARSGCSTSPRYRACRPASPTWPPSGRGAALVGPSAHDEAPQRRGARPPRTIRRRPASRRGGDRPAGQLRRPRRKLDVLRDDVGAPRTGAGSPAADWQRLPLRELEGAGRPRRWWGATLETSVALRAIAIVLVVGSHAGLYTCGVAPTCCSASRDTTSAASA